MKETLEEAIKREYEVRKYNSDFPFCPQSFKLGAKWIEKQMYGEEDMRKAFETGRNFQLTGENNFKELIEQLKKQ
jgi:hypothetical protein